MGSSSEGGDKNMATSEAIQPEDENEQEVVKEVDELARLQKVAAVLPSRDLLGICWVRLFSNLELPAL